MSIDSVVDEWMDEGSDVEGSDVGDVLSDSRTKLIVEYLKEQGGSVDIDDLSLYVAEVETDKSPPPAHVKESVFEDLYTNQIPKLEDAGIIRHEQEIELSESFQGMSRYLSLIDIRKLGWSEFVLGVSVIGLAVIAGHISGVPALTAVGVEIYALVFLALVGLSALYDVADERNGLGP